VTGAPAAVVIGLVFSSNAIFFSVVGRDVGRAEFDLSQFRRA